jgi:HK97 family phage major capsid protein
MASALNTAIEQRAELKAEGMAILAIASAKRTPAQTQRLNAIEGELEAVDRDLARLRQLQADEIAAATGDGGARVAGLRSGRGRKFAEMFPDVARDRGGFTGAEEFLATLHSGLADPRLLAMQNTQVDSAGGFSVPGEVRGQWLDSSLEGEIIRSRADVWPMASSSIAAPGFDDGDHSDNLYGGFAGGWANEGDDLDLEEVKLRLVKLRARKLGILARVSNELIADGVSFDSQLGAAIVKALGWFMDRAFFAGNGASAPMGIFNSPATITVAKEANQAADTIVYANLAKMFARIPPGSHERAVWVANSTTIPQLLQLSVPVGTGGSHVPVLTESGGQFRMLTRPVIFTEKVPALGDRADIGLYDFSQYAIGMRAEFSLAKSMHAGFQKDSVFYRGILRVDGQPKLTAPLTPANGDTLSPFVVLAERA